MRASVPGSLVLRGRRRGGELDEVGDGAGSSQLPGSPRNRENTAERLVCVRGLY